MSTQWLPLAAAPIELSKRRAALAVRLQHSSQQADLHASSHYISIGLVGAQWLQMAGAPVKLEPCCTSSVHKQSAGSYESSHCNLFELGRRTAVSTGSSPGISLNRAALAGTFSLSLQFAGIYACSHCTYGDLGQRMWLQMVAAPTEFS